MYEGEQRTLEICQCQVFIHYEALHLHENGAVACVHFVYAEHAAGHYEPEGRLEVQQRPRLQRGGMGAQHNAVVYIEGILHIAGRVIQGQVQLCEVIIVILHLGALICGKAHAYQCVANSAVGLSHRVQMTLGLGYFTGLGNVYGFPLKAQFLHPCGDLSLAPAELFFKLLLHGVHRLAHRGSLLLAELAHGLEYLRKGTALAKNRNAEGFDFGFVLRGLQAFKCLLPDLLKCLVHLSLSSKKISRLVRRDEGAFVVPP